MFPADLKVDFWLQWFVSDSDTAWNNRWHLLPDGRKFATDTKTAVATSDETNQMPGTLDEKRKTYPALIADLLIAPAKFSVKVPHEQAVKMFGPCDHMKLTTCPRCNGKKQVPHHCGCDLCEAETEKCDFCDGTGTAEEYPEKRHVAAFDRPFDPNQIAYLIAHAPACELYTIELVQRGKDNYVLRVTTDCWQAVIAELSENALRQHECPEVIPADLRAHLHEMVG